MTIWPVVDALAPVFLVIALGAGLRKSGKFGEDVWPALENITYYVLFPVLLAKTLATADLSEVPVAGLSTALLVAIAVMIAILFAARPILDRISRVDGPSFSSLFQTSTRWNTFSALTIVTALWGTDGLTLGAVGVIALIPLLNVFNVIVVTIYGGDSRPGPAQLAVQVVRNPIIWACAIGIAWNLAGLRMAPAFASTLDLVGGGALGIGLLALGAGLDFEAARRDRFLVGVAASLKLVVMPLLVLASCNLLGLDSMTTGVALVCGAVPAANASFILARKLGGNAELVASAITAQVVFSALTLPLIISLYGLQ